MSPPHPTAVLATLYERHTGRAPDWITRLAGDGSARRIYRLSSSEGPSRVGVVGPEPRENRAFVTFTHALRLRGLPVPAVHAVDESEGAWLEDDLGDRTLYDAVVEARLDPADPFPTTLVETYRRVVELLVRLQVEGGQAIPFDMAWPRPMQDARGIRFDLNAFLFQFVRPAGVSFDEVRLEDDFERLIGRLLEEDSRYFLHRDFQSRNLMLPEGRPCVIDYQNGRQGWLGYDIASLLHDAKARIPGPVRGSLLEHYLDALRGLVAVDTNRFRTSFYLSILLRTLQALGAYGLRGLTERKPSFLARIPDRLDDVAALLADEHFRGFPELTRVLERCCADERLRRRPPVEAGTLTVHVGSFSYKRGYPADRGGHGGGMVFDCRGVENPGRDPRFARLSGRDDTVRRFLDTAPKATAFFARVRPLIEDQVEAYRARSFTALDVQFGCTGGQHRSVYFAERLRRHLVESFPDLRVELHHAEAEVWQPISPQAGRPEVA